MNKNPVIEEENIEESWRKIKNNIIKGANEALDQDQNLGFMKR